MKSLKPLTHEKILGYTVGDLGINLNFQMMGFYLAYFYTDVFKIPAYHVGWLFLAARFWDAVNDPLMGFIADRTNTKWGKFRPYLLFGALPLNLILLACFFTPDMPETAKIVYAYVTYIAHGMMFTAVGLPYSSISAVMTQDQQERAVISSYRMFFAVVVALSVIILVPSFASWFDKDTTGYTVAVLAVAAVSTMLLLIAFRNSEERVQMPRERYKVSKIFPLLFKNGPLVSLALAMFLNTCMWVTGNAVAMYYFKYIFKNESLFSIFFFVMLPANILATVLTPIITKRIGKRKAFMIGSAVVVALYLLRHFIPNEYFWTFVGVSLLATFGMMVCSVTQWGMLPDTVEYGQWKTGIRSEGMPFAFFSFMQKMGMAIAGAVAAWVLSAVGYEAGAEQTDATKTAIKMLFNVVPAIYSLLCLIALFFYKLDVQTYDRIVKELKERVTTGTDSDSKEDEVVSTYQPATVDAIGIDRITFILALLSMSILSILLYFGIAGTFNSLAAYIVVGIVQSSVTIVATMSRLKNIGMNPWLSLLQFVPLANIWVTFCGLFYPAGAKERASSTV